MYTKTNSLIDATRNGYYKGAYGYNPDVDTGGVEDIWPNGGTRANILTTETLDLVSSSAEDAVGGSGLHRVAIHGLDADGKMQTEIVVLTGTTPVTTT